MTVTPMPSTTWPNYNVLLPTFSTKLDETSVHYRCILLWLLGWIRLSDIATSQGHWIRKNSHVATCLSASRPNAEKLRLYKLRMDEYRRSSLVIAFSLFSHNFYFRQVLHQQLHVTEYIATTYILLRLEYDLSLTPLTRHQPQSSYRTAFMSSTWMFTTTKTLRKPKWKTRSEA